MGLVGAVDLGHSDTHKMSMIPALLFFSLLAFSEGRQPTCPNNQQPQTDEDGFILQCLPGIPQHATCGPHYTCFFSGMNYMCCPSNEPSLAAQPSCPGSSLTVLDSRGLPLKCDPMSRQCPQDTMFCSDVGRTYICCEKEPTAEDKIERAQEIMSVKKTMKRRKMTTTPASNECPEGSIGLLDHYGNPQRCTASSNCDGFNHFCHGGDGGPICCEKVEFADNKLDPLPEITTVIPPRTRSRQLMHVPLVSGAIEGTGFVRKPNILASGENLGRKSRLNALPIAVAVSPSKTTVPTVEAVAIVETTPTPRLDVSEPTEPLVVFTTTIESPATTRPKAFAIKNQNRENEIQVNSLSRGKASELLNEDEKRAVAQRFLMHQIRNGWPYHDRFYRPDMDAFTNEQRQDIAKLRFIDN